MGARVKLWAWLSVGILAIVAWLGFLSPGSWLDISLFLGVGLVLFCLVNLYRSLDRDDAIPDAEAVRLKSHVLWLGPLGALEVLFWQSRGNS